MLFLSRLVITLLLLCCQASDISPLTAASLLSFKSSLIYASHLMSRMILIVKQSAISRSGYSLCLSSRQFRCQPNDARAEQRYRRRATGTAITYQPMATTNKDIDIILAKIHLFITLSLLCIIIILICVSLPSLHFIWFCIDIFLNEKALSAFDYFPRGYFR